LNAHIDARTEAILDAAMKMIVQKGVHGATIEEIATEAGLSAGVMLLACHLGAHQLDLELQDGAYTDTLLAGVTEMLHKFAPQAK